MVVQGLYNIIDKKLSLAFVASDAIYDQFYIDAYNQITGSAVSVVPLADMR
nr:hypothetical protein [Spiroplasma endosymbiont of Phyllotreta cruciferae]